MKRSQASIQENQRNKSNSLSHSTFCLMKNNREIRKEKQLQEERSRTSAKRGRQISGTGETLIQGKQLLQGQPKEETAKQAGIQGEIGTRKKA